jgi:hypothetical protein
MACSEGPDGILQWDFATKWGQWGSDLWRNDVYRSQCLPAPLSLWPFSCGGMPHQPQRKPDRQGLRRAA